MIWLTNEKLIIEIRSLLGQLWGFGYLGYGDPIFFNSDSGDGGDQGKAENA